MSSQTRRHPLTSIVCWLLMVFLVLFPKGGVKIGPLPLTWGYLILAASMPPLIVIRLLAFSLKPNKQAVLALLMLFPLQVAIAYAFIVFGVIDPSYAFSTFVSLFVLPPLFLLIYSAYLGMVDGRQLSSYLRVCMQLAAVWGIVLFFLHPITGHFIEIPYLTVNAQDYGQIERTKHIARGPYLKLISTYNNGNLYGAATLILLPIHDYLEHSRWRRYIVKTALLLTLSRTVWLGLVINETAPIAAHFWRQLANFPILRLAGVGRRLLAVASMVALVFGAVWFVPTTTVDFLFDPTAGGRVNEISLSRAYTFLPQTGLRAFLEVIYLSALQDLGYFGLLSMVLLMGSPLLLLAFDRRALQSPLRRAALRGLIVYALVALSDGGFNLIPVMAFYWFTYMIYIFGWPSFLPTIPRTRWWSLTAPARRVPPATNRCTSTALSSDPAMLSKPRNRILMRRIAPPKWVRL
jgi:hypothetical protein